MLWRLKQRGWHPRVEPEWTPNRLVGSSVAAGLALFRRQYNSMGLAAKEAPEVLQTAYRVLEEGYVAQETWTLPTLQGLVARGVRLALDGPQMVGVASVVLAEQSVYGRKPDVVLRDTEGRLLVDDDKVIMALDAHQESWRLAEYEHSWQFRDYDYHVSEYLSEPVYQVRAHLIILGPRKHVTLHPMTFSPESRGQWYRSACSVWETMQAVEEGAQVAWQNLLVCTNKSTHFGQRCPMYDACHLFHCDERQMETLYERFVKEF